MGATCVCFLLKKSPGPLSFISHCLELVVASLLLPIKQYRAVSISARCVTILNTIGVPLVRKKGKMDIKYLTNLICRI